MLEIQQFVWDEVIKCTLAIHPGAGNPNTTSNVIRLKLIWILIMGDYRNTDQRETQE